MKNNKPQWIKNPTKKQVLIVFFAWIGAIFLLTLSMTNFLVESPFKLQNMVLLFLILMSGFTTITVLKNYNKNKKAGGVVE